MHMGCKRLALQRKFDQPGVLNIGPVGHDAQAQSLSDCLTHGLAAAHFKVDPYRNTVLTQDLLKHPSRRGPLFAKDKILTLKIVERHGPPSAQTGQWMSDWRKNHKRLPAYRDAVQMRVLNAMHQYAKIAPKIHDTFDDLA